MSEGPIWVIVEHDEGRERPVVYELLSEGRRAADALGVELHAIVLGEGLEDLCRRLEGHPDRIVCLESPHLQQYGSDAYVLALEQRLQQQIPSLIMTSSGLRAMDFMPRLAARIGVGMLSDVTHLEVSDAGAVRVRRPIHGGRVYVDLEAQDRPPHLLTVRPRAFKREDGAAKAEFETVSVQLGDEDIRVRLLEKVKKPRGDVELTEASVVVTGGRGMRGPEHFELLEELADLMGAAVGASRAVVDSKWRPADEQVGKSGKTVSPGLYLAFGVSGAIHHIMGMDTSKFVVAINNDPNAMIFRYADWGVVDDVFEILPVLIEELKSRK